jgi:hypothetical protein
MPQERLDRAEVGARRHLDPLGAAAGAARWGEELEAALRALRRALAEGGAAVLLLADSVVAGAPVYALDLLRGAAPRAGFALRAVASQPRPHFHAGSARAFARRPRAEHAILLTALSPPAEPPRALPSGPPAGPAAEPVRPPGRTQRKSRQIRPPRR